MNLLELEFRVASLLCLANEWAFLGKKNKKQEMLFHLLMIAYWIKQNHSEWESAFLYIHRIDKGI